MWEVIETGTVRKDRMRCSECGFIRIFIDGHSGQYNYCPQCGAKQAEADTEPKPKDEPQISGKPYKIETSSVCKDEPQKWETPPKFEHKEVVTTCVSVPAFAIETDDFFREPTEEERKAVREYIDSISVPTGVNIFALMDKQTKRSK